MNQADANGTSMLMVASGYGHTKLVELLLQNGARVNKQTKARHLGCTGFSSLHLAVAHGHFDVVSTLIAWGAKIDTKAHNGTLRCTPLMLAARSGRADMCQRLLLAGARTDTRDGRSAILMAKANGHEACVKAMRSG